MKPKYVIVKRNKKTYFDNPWKLLSLDGSWTTQEDEHVFFTKNYDKAMLVAYLRQDCCVVNLNKEIA